MINNYENTVKLIVNRLGGFREKDVMNHPHTIEKAETWNNDHKVLNVLSTEVEGDGYRSGFAVDIVTRSICG